MRVQSRELQGILKLLEKSVILDSANFKLCLISFFIAKSSFKRFKFQPNLPKELGNKITSAFTFTEGNVCANKLYSLLFNIKQQPADENIRKIQSSVRQKEKNKFYEEKSETALQSGELHPLDFEHAKIAMIDCLTETKTVDEHFTEMKNSVEKLFTTLKTFLRKQLSLYGWKKEFPMLVPMPSEGENWKFFKL